ncbi:LAMI_0G09780g1_1 [Lachancea mirantina]|uniref:LAMI_0G09780g1_1 n=1 Tax=Lachancea mirantina TaxID=1230905 RepID=A0A1G4KAE6_9SACH|nr:LAMI_0G09780g1_1 [Lachancea mirantina]
MVHRTPLSFSCLFLMFSCLCLVNFCHATPFNDKMTKIAAAFDEPDKICSISEAAGDGGYRRLISRLTGINLKILGVDDTLFTGFRFHRVYKFNYRITDATRYLQMSYCKKGKLQWSRDMRYDADVEWEKPLCIYAPREAGESKNAVKNSGFPKWRKPKSDAANAISLKQSALADLDNFRCFKMARRKRYARRPFSLYLPNTWIGALFECKMPNSAKKIILQQMSSQLLQISPLALDLSYIDSFRPVLPLLSDSYKGHWTELERKSRWPILNRFLKWQVNRIVPFLSTPLYVDEEFHQGADYLLDRNLTRNYISATNSSWSFPLENCRHQYYKLDSKKNSKAKDSQWFNEVDPLENYDYSSQDDSIRDKFAEKLFSQVENLTNSATSKEKLLNSLELDLTGNQSLVVAFAGRMGHHLKAFRKNKEHLWTKMNFVDRIMSTYGMSIFEEKMRATDSQPDTIDGIDN